MDSDLLEISEDEFSTINMQYSNLTPFHSQNSLKILMNKIL